MIHTNHKMLIYRAGRAAEREKRRGARILGAEAVTRESIELGFILGEIPGYEFSMGNFSGRPSLQKVVYLLQAFGVSLGYSFSWYLRGPYCSSLATKAFTPDRVYNFSDHDTQFKDRRAQKKLPRFPKFIRGKDLESLEILASAHYLRLPGLRGNGARNTGQRAHQL